MLRGRLMCLIAPGYRWAARRQGGSRFVHLRRGGVTAAAEGLSAKGVKQGDVAQIRVRDGSDLLPSPVWEVAALAVNDGRKSSPVSLVL